MQNTIFCIVGPTAIGKTAFSIELAKHINSEIISADSRQMYKEVHIGTAKPSTEEMQHIPHHFIDNLSIHDHYTAGIFEKEALQTIDKIFKKGKTPIVVGGSGLYVNALLFGLNAIPSDANIRQKWIELYHQNGLGYIQNELQKHDEKTWAIIDKKNPQRLIRALEVLELTGRSFSSFHSKTPKKRPFKTELIGLEIPRKTLYQNINVRVDKMVKTGLFQEVHQHLNHRQSPLFKTIGYREPLLYFDGKSSKDQAIEQIKINTRRFAKRQITWFKKNQNTQWLTPCFSNIEKVLDEHKKKSQLI